MKFNIYKTTGQIYLLPYIGITYTKYLNGNYELFVGWLKHEIVITIK